MEFMYIMLDSRADARIRSWLVVVSDRGLGEISRTIASSNLWLRYLMVYEHGLPYLPRKLKSSAQRTDTLGGELVQITCRYSRVPNDGGGAFLDPFLPI